MANCKVAVLLSTFNGEKFLDEFLLSLDKQEGCDISLIVRDDQSSDSSLQILKRNRKTSNNFQLLTSTGHLGAAGSYFTLLSEAGDGFDYYAFADQDDVWLPDKTHRAVTILSTGSENIPTLYSSRMEYVDKKLNHLKWSRLPRRIGFGNAIVENVATGCTVVVNRVARELILSGLPDKSIMHDWWCYLTIACFGRVIFDDFSGIKYRQHAGNAIGAATVFADDVNRRVARFFKSEGGVFRISNQGSEYLRIFGNKLPVERKRVLNLIAAGKHSLKDRIRLAMSQEIWRQRFVDNFILRILILINHY
jgi:glycosyltransferase involved in cell wall biosynthesis